MKRDFLSLYDFSGEELEALLERAKELKAKQKRGEDWRPLEGKTLAMIFEKPSTRTRVSFEVGMYQLGGHALFLSLQETQLGRGESIADTARVLSRYVDGIMIRTFAHRTVEELARFATVPVINGLSDLLHPCQILSDIFTIWETLGDYRVKVAYVGDGNNVANSWINGALKMGVELRLACPPGYGPDRRILERAIKEGARVILTHDPKEAARGAQVLYTDVWASMGQESERQRRLEVFKPYQLNGALLELAAPGALVMHCLPAHRGEEITDEVIDGPQSVVFDQAENRLHVQKAILEWLMG